MVPLFTYKYDSIPSVTKYTGSSFNVDADDIDYNGKIY
jgi:hypothetical protein